MFPSFDSTLTFATTSFFSDCISSKNLMSFSPRNFFISFRNSGLGS